MSIMSVDDSVSSSYADHMQYFVLSEVIICNDKINDLQRVVFEYKQANFTGEMIDSEIHTQHLQIERNFSSYRSHNKD